VEEASVKWRDEMRKGGEGFMDYLLRGSLESHVGRKEQSLSQYVDPVVEIGNRQERALQALIVR
jgi:hypothetical protein